MFTYQSGLFISKILQSLFDVAVGQVTENEFSCCSKSILGETSQISRE